MTQLLLKRKQLLKKLSDWEGGVRYWLHIQML
jgi:hypothetical protein